MKRWILPPNEHGKRNRAFCMIWLLAMWATMVLRGSVAAAGTWPNEPAGSTNVFDCPFSGNVCGMDDIYESTVFTADPATPTGGTNQVLDNYLAANSTYGSGQQVFYLPDNTREVYVGTWWKTNPEFQGNGGGLANKMLFISGNGNNNFLNWFGESDAARNLYWSNQSEQNNCNVSGWSGECGGGSGSGVVGGGGFNANVSGAGYIAAGTGWHRIEIYQKASSSDVSRDGIIRMWIDGTLTTNYTNLNLSPDGFTDVQYNHTWDGTWAYDCATRDCSRSWHHYFDHLRISIPSGADPVTMPLAINSPLQTTARVGTSYADTLGAENGKAPYGWTISAGSLPPGLTLNKTTGVLSGKPTTVGRSNFTVKVMDSSVPAKEATKAFTIIVSQSTGIGGKQLTVNSSRLTAESRMGSVRFHLPQTGNGNYRVSIFDLAGKNVYENKANASGQKELRIEAALKNGIYFAKISQGQKVSTVRFNVIN